MPRSPSPLAYIKMSGAAVKNPGVYRGLEEANSPPLGDPTEGTGPGAAAEWRRFQEEVPWLKECHRAVMEIASSVRADVRGGRAKASDMRLLLSILSAIGATPATESRVRSSSDPDEEDDEFDS